MSAAKKARDAAAKLMLWTHIGRSSRTVQDALFTLIWTAPVLMAAIYFDAFDNFYEFSREHEDWELDELACLTLYFFVAACVFSARRIIELRNEVKQRVAAEQEANRLARHDGLTGLPNRRQFINEFNARRKSKGELANFAIFVIDLDNFKPINDVHGHVAGDAVLRAVANRLSMLAGEDGVVARLGGDEFAMLSCTESGTDASLRLAQRVVHELAKAVRVEGTRINVSASVGITQYPENAKDLHTLIRQADTAMYGAKSEGRGLYRFFDPEMDVRLHERVALERELANAIEDDKIIPYYHPLVDLHTRETIGFEVLARWQHPKRGLIPPAVFVPIAEDSGLIGPMTYSLLRRACTEIADWGSEQFLSVNLAPVQLTEPWIAEEILGILNACNFPAHRLKIEITETALVEKLDVVKTAIKSLRNLGVRIALDDFGTGYSGLYHLRELTLDTLKIDQSFIMNMLSDPESCKIVEAIIGLGKALDLEVTAEGIETEEVMDKLSEMGCQTGQGFYFGKPRPAAEISKEMAASVAQGRKQKSA